MNKLFGNQIKLDHRMLQQGGTATGVEGTAELYSLEGSGETPPQTPFFCDQENEIIAK